MNKQQFWFDDISTLVNQDYLQDFIPMKEMNTSEKLNAIMRFCMYLSVILILVTGNSNYIFVVIGGAILTYIIHINKDEAKTESKPNSDEVKNYTEVNVKVNENEQIKPTKDNLFGNVSVVDIGNKKTEDAPKAEYESQFQELLKKDNFNEPDHMYKEKMSLRQFYKVPNTFDSESRKKFMNWCYEPSKK